MNTSGGIAWTGAEIKILRNAVLRDGMKCAEISRLDLLPGRTFMSIFKQMERQRINNGRKLNMSGGYRPPSGVKASSEQEIWETHCTAAVWYRANNDRAVEAMIEAGMGPTSYGGERWSKL